MASHKVLEIIGEGKTDIGDVAAETPHTGVVAILVHSLCGRPAEMRVKRKPVSFLQGKRWPKKVKFAKRQAKYNGSAGVVFVLDTEGDCAGRMKDLVEGRDAALNDYPMAVGVTHPCVESWLLADARAIRKAMSLPASPQVPEEPEALPAPQHNRKHNPKTILASCAGCTRSELSSAEKDRIAVAINDVSLLCARCPLGFAPFAAEVQQRIKPLFVTEAATTDAT